MKNSKNNISWNKIVQAVVQAIVAALTALGVSSCATHF
ncbi:MAG: smalltalk protein [Oscillibacter sp.]|nr:smalltalk protein [Oscillibacter sp.]